jgi:hypothetical protein
MSSHDPRLLIGLGTDQKSVALTVRWPSGAISRLPELATNQTHEINEPAQSNPGAAAPN